jgi:hypothetical protein
MIEDHFVGAGNMVATGNSFPAPANRFAALRNRTFVAPRT